MLTHGTWLISHWSATGVTVSAVPATNTRSILSDLIREAVTSAQRLVLDWLSRDPDGPYVPLEQHTIGFPPTIVDDFGAALDVAAKIVGVSKDFDLLERCERDVRAALADSAFVARSQRYYLDITHPLANKGVALTEIAKLLGIPLTEIAAIGDGSNDVAMFERSGLSIAMGNASPQVQRKADFVTDSNRHDGFAKAIERFILGGDRSRALVEPAKAGDRAC